MTVHHSLTGLNLVHFAWRELVRDEDGLRFVPPHSDPNLYEFPLDFIFGTPDEARDWLAEWRDDLDDPTEADQWFLIRVDQAIVGGST